MPVETNNPFRQVALVLISLTIIVLGVAYNQATSKSEAEITIPNKTAVTYQPAGSSMGVNTDQSTPESNTQTTTPSVTAPSTTPTPNATTNNNQTTVVPATPDWEKLNNSLELIGQLAKLPAISFAYNNFDIKAPGIGLVNTPTIDNDLLDLPTLETSPATSTPALPQIIAPATTPPTNQVISVIKALTGYSQWEQFKTKFREAEQKYAGTGKCMINVSGFGCLATW